MRRNAALRARLQHLLSYLVISMVPVLLCGILLIYNGYGQSVREIEQTAYAGLGLFKNSYEYLLQSMDISVSHFHANGALTHAAPADIAAQLAVYKANYPNFSEIIYYAKGSSDIIASDGVHPYKDFQQSLPGDADLDMSNLFVNLNGATSPTVLRARNSRMERLGGDYLIFLQPVPVLSANPEGMLTFFLPVEHLVSQVEDCIGSSYALYLLADRHLTPLYRSEATLGKLEDRLNKLRGAGIFHEKVDGESYVFMRVLGVSHPVYHLIAFSENTLYARAIIERSRQLGLLCGLVVLTALAAIVLHSRIYQPIRQMIELPLPQGDGGESARDIYAHVRNRMRDVTVQNDRLSEQIADQRLILRQQTLHNLICGYVERGSEEYLASAGVNARLAWYTAAYVTLYLEGNEPHTLADGDMWALAEAKAYIVGLQDANRIAILFNHAGGEAQRASLAEQAVEQLALRALTVQSMGMGASCQRLEDIALSFLQAQAVAYEEDTRKVCLFESSKPASMQTPFMPVSDKLLLCQCIRKGEEDIALSTLRKMRSDVSILAQTPSVVRGWCFFVYDAVLNVLEELGLPEMVERMPRLEVYGAPDTLCHLLEPILRETCERVRREEKQQKKDLQASILQYVSEHFHDQEMSLEYLGSVFQLSESYLTRFFRKKTGQSFLQYISELRMEKVKRLLTETELPIKDIVTKAGYVDVANFTRKFRQQEGCTPGNWRLAHRLEGEQTERSTECVNGR